MGSKNSTEKIENEELAKQAKLEEIRKTRALRFCKKADADNIQNIPEESSHITTSEKKEENHKGIRESGKRIQKDEISINKRITMEDIKPEAISNIDKNMNKEETEENEGIQKANIYFLPSGEGKQRKKELFKKEGEKDKSEIKVSFSPPQVERSKETPSEERNRKSNTGVKSERVKSDEKLKNEKGVESKKKLSSIKSKSTVSLMERENKVIRDVFRIADTNQLALKNRLLNCEEDNYHLLNNLTHIFNIPNPIMFNYSHVDTILFERLSLTLNVCLFLFLFFIFFL